MRNDVNFRRNVERFRRPVKIGRSAGGERPSRADPARPSRCSASRRIGRRLAAPPAYQISQLDRVPRACLRSIAGIVAAAHAKPARRSRGPAHHRTRCRRIAASIAAADSPEASPVPSIGEQQ
ncbi:hypothetical protein GTH10_17305 [Burkholderia thailandensis]|uniref:hypothetical protein n=1 Tax=Burkholderia thailandensis TaxID=57975 RepID=UPI00148E9DDE|nr:hypothetical protein [Burkholderia thailandensis]NOK49097.1 hypothetical protein [Burkholderia thailandensis]